MRGALRLELAALFLAACATSRAQGPSEPPTRGMTAEPPASEETASSEAPPPEAAEEARPPSEPTRAGTRGAAAPCPAAIEGTTVRATDVEGGAALTFTTQGDVTELRRSAERMAEMHNRHQGGMMMYGRGGMMRGYGGAPGPRGEPPATAAPGGRGPRGMGGPGRGMGPGPGAMVPADARVETVEGGARVVYTPRDPSALGALREDVELRAERMASAWCPLYGGATEDPGASPNP